MEPEEQGDAPLRGRPGGTGGQRIGAGRAARSRPRLSLAASFVLVAAGCGMVEPLSPPPADHQAERAAAAAVTVTQAPTTTVPTTTTSSRPVTTTTAPTTTSTTRRSCPPTRLPHDLPDVTDPAAFTLALTRATLTCADRLVLVDSDPTRIEQASRLALADHAALLVTAAEPDPAQVEEIQRLAPSTVTVLGVAAPEGPWRQRTAAAPVTTGPPPRPSAGDQVWLVRAGDGRVNAAVPLAALSGAAVIPTRQADPRALGDEQRARLAAAESVRLVGPFSDSAPWQLEVVRAGAELPGGGQLLFPGRRLLAFYGSPRSASLGVLGEAGPDETFESIAALSDDYATEGVAILPTFELIATLATNEPGPDGDYSDELSVEALRPWVETAAERGAYVVLDLQPGRSDFLTQARRYQQLLELPHVGLALDPEWRLGGDEVHLDQIGSVSSQEVNAVVGWLAELVRRERLPQKLLVIHQFKFSMIHERQDIKTPSELAVVVQMDGQGPLRTKYATYDALVRGTEGAGWRWGWKSFFDEDHPLPTPEDVLSRDPTPVFVSFQ